MSEGPLRYEDYIAMAAENDQLRRKIAGMETRLPPVYVKEPKMNLNWLYNWFFNMWSWHKKWSGIVVLVSVVIIVAWFFCYADARSDIIRAEKEVNPKCYSVSPSSGDTWEQRYQLVRHRSHKGGQDWLSVVPYKLFATPQDAFKFLEDTNSPICK